MKLHRAAYKIALGSGEDKSHQLGNTNTKVRLAAVQEIYAILLLIIMRRNETCILFLF